MKIDTARKVKVIDARTSGCWSLEEEDVVIIVLSQREKRFADFFSTMSRCRAVIVCSQLEVVIKKPIHLLRLFSAPEFAPEKNNAISELLNNNEIDFLRITLKGFTVLQYSRLRDVVPMD